jgi:hypothetical protein
LFRQLYQHVIATANLPTLQPRPLKDAEIKPGTAEFVITQGIELPGSAWINGGLLIPRGYLGYIAVHYAAETSQHETFDDEANVFRALATFRALPAVASNPAFRELGDAPSVWFLNTDPVKAELPPVLTLNIDFSVQLDLTIQEGTPP